jgi:hypothetical protein
MTQNSRKGIKMRQLTIRRLATILEDGMLVWNQKHYGVLVLLSHWLGFRLAADHVYASTIVYWKKVGMIHCILHDQTTKFRNTCTRRSHKTDLPDHVRGPKDHCHIGAGR